jgi:hypothetical protein
MSPKEAIIQANRRWRHSAKVQLPNAKLPELLVFIQNLREATVTGQWSGALMGESSLGKIS